jgi:hypothetical protein
MNPFRQLRGHIRVACQIVYLQQVDGGTLIDMVTLEPSRWDGRHVDAGTPFALGFAASHPGAQSELEGTMRTWEQACVVVDLMIDEEPQGLRYEFTTGHHQLVVQVDRPDLPSS